MAFPEAICLRQSLRTPSKMKRLTHLPSTSVGLSVRDNDSTLFVHGDADGALVDDARELAGVLVDQVVRLTREGSTIAADKERVVLSDEQPLEFRRSVGHGWEIDCQLSDQKNTQKKVSERRENLTETHSIQQQYSFPKPNHQKLNEICTHKRELARQRPTCVSRGEEGKKKKDVTQKGEDVNGCPIIHDRDYLEMGPFVNLRLRIPIYSI